MYANLKSTDKSYWFYELGGADKQSIAISYTPLGNGHPYSAMDLSGKAKKDCYHRFEELMAQELIDYFDPQYMEKLNTYVNKTGLDPRQDWVATIIKQVAKYYGWVRMPAAASVFGAFCRFLEITGNVKTQAFLLTQMRMSEHRINRRGYSIDDFLLFDRCGFGSFSEADSNRSRYSLADRFARFRYQDG